jgi:ubiquinone/menaquinone biosynthesis C-methylase UbiE
MGKGGRSGGHVCLIGKGFTRLAFSGRVCFFRPVNLDAVQQQSAEQFNRQSGQYGKGHLLKQTDDLRRALPFLQVRPGQRLLDVACGAGHTGLYFAKLGMDVTMTDVSTGMLAQARALAEGEGVVAEFFAAPAEKLPFADGVFDLVTCRVAAHHFSCPASFVMESARVLKPGGRFLVIDGTVEDGHSAAEAWIHEVEKIRDPSHQRFIRPLQWKHLCGHIDLEVIHDEVFPLKQPDLEWYFEAAGTAEEGRERVRQLVAEAPREARELFRIGREEEKWVWWWQRLILIAVKRMS